MIKVAMIGAGSVVFSKNLTADILSYPEFKNATFSYMDIDEERLEVGANLCRKVAKAMGANPTIQATTDRREALQGADFVINMVQIGGFDSTLVDFEIPRKYGLNFTIADTTGPGGLFRALRTYPMIKGLCEDMTEICPKAVLLNYSNPMSMNMQTVFRTSDIQAVGLCHSVQSSLKRILRHIGEEPDGVVFQCAGINHMAFYTRLEKNGEDLYPRLFDALDELEAKGTHHVRMELMKRLGYFVTESSEHHSEYSSFFIAPGAQTIDKFHVPIDEYLRRCNGIVDEFERMKTFSVSDEPMEIHRSHEYGSTIIHSIATGQPSVVYGNMPNNGAISNLPATAIVEVPTLVDSAGLQFTTYGELPPELVGYMQPHITQHELFIRAAMEGRRDHVYQACFYDPLTAATLTMDQIVEMCDELIVAHGDVLPELDRKTSRVRGSGKTFAPPTPQEMRASWDAAQHKAGVENIESWSVIGPFAANDAATVEATLFANNDGSIDLTAAHSTQNESETRNWKLVSTHEEMVDLSNFDEMNAAVAYAYAEVDSVHARDAVIKCGGEGALKIWLNGQVVHETKDSTTDLNNEFSAHLNEGKNRFLVKTQRTGAAWSFSLAVPQANF